MVNGKHKGSSKEPKSNHKKDVHHPEPPQELPPALDSQIIDHLISDLPPLLAADDDKLCKVLLGEDRIFLSDMVQWFAKQENLAAQDEMVAGPLQWIYDENRPADSFMYYKTAGCPNCGSALDDLWGFAGLDDGMPRLECQQCGHSPAPLHFIGESDSLSDRMQGLHLPQEIRNEVIRRQAASAAGRDPVDVHPPHLTSNETNDYTLQNRLGSSHRPPSGVFIRGQRSCYRMSQAEKEWWQDRFRPAAWRDQNSTRNLETIIGMDKVKAPTTKEICEECGHDTAFYHTFQARSADEGMTIMFECCECHARCVKNT